jgi:hypothetical protein
LEESDFFPVEEAGDCVDESVDVIIVLYVEAALAAVTSKPHEKDEFFPAHVWKLEAFLVEDNHL